jgi:DNA-binding HxlR family transcriptional regulator
MGNTPTEKKTAELLKKELSEIIGHSLEFSNKLKDVIHEYDIDVSGERKATVEVLQLILQKWVIEIMHILFLEERLRFNDIKRNLKGISSRTLTSKLRLLQDAGFIERDVTSERPTIVEYSLTKKGHILAELSCPIICFLKLEGLKTG